MTLAPWLELSRRAGMGRQVIESGDGLSRWLLQPSHPGRQEWKGS